MAIERSDQAVSGTPTQLNTAEVIASQFTKLGGLFIPPNWWRHELPGRWMCLASSCFMMGAWLGFRADVARPLTVNSAVFIIVTQDGNSNKQTPTKTIHIPLTVNLLVISRADDPN